MVKTVQTQKKKIDLDEDGFLKNIDDWNVKMAEDLATLEGIKELSGEHWKLITAIRFHYERVGKSPLCRDIHVESGFTKNDMYKLFPPFGYRTAYKLAGLPKPIEC